LDDLDEEILPQIRAVGISIHWAKAIARYWSRMSQQNNGNNRRENSGALKVQEEKYHHQHRKSGQKAPVSAPETGAADLIQHFHGHGALIG
jgi:hypothetical protein